MPDFVPDVPPPKVPIGASARFESRVTSGISHEVLNAYRAEPPQGNEVGGILLGIRSGDPILVTDFEPVLCQHSFGPLFALSEEDLRGLEESLEWFRTPGSTDLQVLGFYRSHARPEGSLDERDHELMRRFFPDAESIFLLLKPGRGDAIVAELFALAEGSLRPTGHPMLFPNGRAVSADAVPVVAAPAPRQPLPPPRARREVTTRHFGEGSWRWVAALIALTLTAAVMGYRSIAPKRPEPVQESAPIPPVPQTPASTPSNPAPSPAESKSVAAAPAEKGVREALEQWEQAALSGDPNRLAACYDPRADGLRRAVLESVARFGKPAILRISDLTVTPVSETQAVASFRKHWQTSGPKIFAGEEQERFTFVKRADTWKIASAEEIKVYWRQGPTA